jgi:hypothetical protein
LDGASPAIHLQYGVPEVPWRCYRVTVIRNVVLVKLKPGQDPAEVADIQDEFRRLNCPGTLSYTIGSDLGLHEGNWSFAIVADFANAHAYRAYDRDSLHNRARARLAPLVEQIARAQFEVPRDPFL